MRSARKRLVSNAVAAGLGGLCFQFGCNLGLGSLLNNFNPCGTILNCDARAYQFVTSGIDGPGVVPDIDPFCTFPPFCTSTEDPIFGGLVTEAQNP